MKGKIVYFAIGLFVGIIIELFYNNYRFGCEEKKVINVVLSNLDSERRNNHYLGLSIMYKQIRENIDSIKIDSMFITNKLETYWDTPFFSKVVVIDTAKCIMLIHNKNNIGHDYLLENDTIYEIKLIPLVMKIDTLFFKEVEKNHWKLDPTYHKDILLKGINTF
jgi:hypothetical protein